MINKKDVLILASGGGTNAQAIVQQSQQGAFPINFVGGSNKTREKAGVYSKLEPLSVKMHYLPSPKDDFSAVYNFLENNRFDLIVLAGYMRILPADIADNYNIINIHPSILPFVYKGSEDAYADAFNNKDLYTGCTVHKVIGEPDAGPIIAQLSFKIPDIIYKTKNLDLLKQIGLAHEHALYFEVIKHLLFETNQQINMFDIVKSAQKNLTARGLPKTSTMIPNNVGAVFEKFNATNNFNLWGLSCNNRFGK